MTVVDKMLCSKSHEYVYEENGNWKKQTIYRNNKPYQEIERKIVLD